MQHPMADNQIIPCLRVGAVSQPTHTAPNVPPAFLANAACRTREPFLQSQLDIWGQRGFTRSRQQVRAGRLVLRCGAPSAARPEARISIRVTTLLMAAELCWSATKSTQGLETLLYRLTQKSGSICVLGRLDR